MASTGKAALDDSVFAEIVESQMVPELRPANTSRSFLRMATGGASTVASFPLWTDPGAAASPTDDLSEIASTALADTQQSATAAGVGFRVDVTDLIRASHPSDLYSEVAGIVTRSMKEKFETDVAALMDDFSNVTTAGSTLTPVDLLAAVSALEQRDIPGPYVAYLDPKQTGELRQDIATTTAVYQAGRDGELVSPFGVDGFFGNYMGVPIWQSSLTVTTGSLVGGAVFAAGPGVNAAIGCYELIPQRLATQRDESYAALEFVGYHAYGLVEISDTRGQTLKSAA
jgi:hypothetical protein